MTFNEPPNNCALCPRLSEFREGNKVKFPDKFNSPVPAFGDLSAKLLIVGLAPGLKGANFTGRPFTGDYAGDLLYKSLLHFDLAEGSYGKEASDGLTLKNCRITNAVRCVPPKNKPTTQETLTCLEFLKTEISSMPNLKAILSLGKISHDAVLRMRGEKLSAYKFAHGAQHNLGDGLTLIDSYHCSRYNTQTGRLSEEMFFDIFGAIDKIA